LLAHTELFQFSLIKVFDCLEESVIRFMKSFPEYPIRACSLEETAASDIVCTVTPAREPFLKRAWIAPGAHINAIGADASGKQELEPSILRDATVVVDHLEQAAHSGEMNVPLREGLFKIEDVYATLDEIITGKKEGRGDKQVITVFDSTGLAIEDIAVAKLVYEKAKAIGGYLSLDFVEG